MEDLSGRQPGQYRVVAPLGEGGMATIYQAYQPRIDRYVALKVLPRHYASDPTFVGRCEQEAMLIANLEHPNILPIHDYGQDDGYTYLVMRYVRGGTLADAMGGQPFAASRALGILTQIASALDHAHSRGVIHRDIKPSNVLIDEQGNCFLTDFGIAKMLEAATRFTVTGGFVGTPTYASPEQCLGRDLDGRSDVYSLGVMLYEMATGRPPFDAETPMAVAVKQIHDPLPLPSKINPLLPEGVERVILKALAKEPGDRYATAGEMVGALSGAVAAAREPGIPDSTRHPPALAPVGETVLYGADSGQAGVAAPLPLSPTANERVDTPSGMTATPGPASGMPQDTTRAVAPEGAARPAVPSIQPSDRPRPRERARRRSRTPRWAWFVIGAAVLALAATGVFAVHALLGVLQTAPATPTTRLRATSVPTRRPRPRIDRQRKSLPSARASGRSYSHRSPARSNPKAPAPLGTLQA